MQLPAPIQVRLHWRSGADATPSFRERVDHEVGQLAWEISQMEALLQDAIRVAGHERGYLLPRIELRIPLYEDHRRLRLVLSHVENTRIHLVDEEGRRMADVVLL